MSKTPPNLQAEQGGVAALDSIANNAAPSEDKTAKKGAYLREKYTQRAYMRRVLKGTRCATCGRLATAGAGVGLYYDEVHGARYSGLQSCGSVWCCPVCNAKIQTHRMGEIRQALEWARDGGYSVVFATHTVRHNRRQSLKDVRDMAATVWRKCRSHAPVKKLFKRYGSKGYTRSTEVTWSKANGWHVHYHSFYFLRGGMTQAQVDSFGASYAANWIKTAGDNGYEAPTEENQRFELLNLSNKDDLDAAAAYLTQAKTANLRSAAHELTNTQSKLGKVIEHNDGTRVLHLSYFDMLRAYTDISRAKALKNGRNSRIYDSVSTYIIGQKWEQVQGVFEMYAISQTPGMQMSSLACIPRVSLSLCTR